MNKTIAITATVMFAVILGISAMTPALAVKQATVQLCHQGVTGIWTYSSCWRKWKSQLNSFIIDFVIWRKRKGKLEFG